MAASRVLVVALRVHTSRSHIALGQAHGMICPVVARLRFVFRTFEIMKPQRLNTLIAFVLEAYGIMLTELECTVRAVVSGAFVRFSTSEHVCSEA